MSIVIRVAIRQGKKYAGITFYHLTQEETVALIQKVIDGQHLSFFSKSTVTSISVSSMEGNQQVGITRILSFKGLTPLRTKHLLVTARRKQYIPRPIQLNRKNNPRPLSARQIEILLLICKELSPKEISHRLGISEKTYSNHRAQIISKTHAKSSIGLYRYAVQHGYVEFKGIMPEVISKK